MTAERYEAFDLLATLVALARPDGTVLFANTGFEAAVGLSRRALARTSLFDHFTDPAPLRETLLAVARNEIATGRLEATLRVAGAAMAAEDLPVHVIVTQVEARGDARRPRARSWCWSRCSRSSSRRGKTARSVRSTRSRPIAS